MLPDHLGITRADFLLQLAQHGCARVLAVVNSALRQLPAASRSLSIGHVSAERDKDQPIAIEQYRADIRPVGQVTHRSFSGFGCAGGVASALTGARTRPRSTKRADRLAS